jgi:hypothetical protein
VNETDRQKAWPPQATRKKPEKAWGNDNENNFYLQSEEGR